ncbi:MAG TPA: hypothetical protein VIF62_13595 [Labilithrix sp.]
MRRALAVAIASSVLALALLTGAETPSAAEPTDAGADAPPPPVPACIAVSSEARYVPWGYNHVVTLRNGCTKNATCVVSTDVNPQTQVVDVASGAAVEVMTFMGSPSYTFVARVNCRLR